MIAYRLTIDLQRGWRITAPNLDQVGLMHVRYSHLDEIAHDAAWWCITQQALAARNVRRERAPWP